MTNRELQEELKKFPDDLLVVFEFDEKYRDVTESFSVTQNNNKNHPFYNSLVIGIL